MQVHTAKLICFTGSGDSVECGHGIHISGYGSPARPHAADPTKDNLIIPDGCPVLDKRPAIETRAGYDWVFRGPLVDVDLPAGDVDRCPAPDAVFAAAVADTAYGMLLAHHASHKDATPGPLDSVSIPEYIEGWRSRGARVGHYQDGAIVWEDMP